MWKYVENVKSNGYRDIQKETEIQRTIGNIKNIDKQKIMSKNMQNMKVAIIIEKCGRI